MRLNVPPGSREIDHDEASLDGDIELRLVVNVLDCRHDETFQEEQRRNGGKEVKNLLHKAEQQRFRNGTPNGT